MFFGLKIVSSGFLLFCMLSLANFYETLLLVLKSFCVFKKQPLNYSTEKEFCMHLYLPKPASMRHVLDCRSCGTAKFLHDVDSIWCGLFVFMRIG